MSHARRCVDRCPFTRIFDYNVRLASATGLFPNVEYHELGRKRVVG